MDISSNDLSRCTEIAKTLKDHLKHNSALQILFISWKYNNITYAYNAETDNKCYVTSHNYNTFYHWRHEHCKYFVRHVCYKLQFDDIEALLLTAFVHDNVNIKILDITDKVISETAAIVISNFIYENTTLQKLIFAGNKISGKAIQLVMKAIQINTTLQSLNISFNNINDDGAAAISECLKNNSKLQELDVSHNEVSNTGIVNIGEALQMNATLQILDISHNNIFDDGIINGYISTSDEDDISNCMLQEVDLLCDYSISSKGIVDLSECLKTTMLFKNL